MKISLLLRPLSWRSRPLARHALGFTLIELMITVAIVAILAAIAYPSYTNYVLRGQVVNATNGLSALQANMERFYQDNRTYASTTGTTVFVSPCLVTTAIVIGNFTFTCSIAPTLTGYTLQAAGNAGTSVAGFIYTVDQTNVQNTVITGTKGWNTTGTGMTCWVTKQGPTC